MTRPKPSPRPTAKATATKPTAAKTSTRAAPARATTTRSATQPAPRVVPPSKVLTDKAQDIPRDETGDSEPSLGQLVATATKDFSSLLHQEVALAKAELKTEIVSAGKGAGLFSGAGASGLFALVFLSVALAYGIAGLADISVGFGFLAVGLLYLTSAAVLGLLGKKKIGEVGPPEKTIETVKDDIAWAKHPTRTT